MREAGGTILVVGVTPRYGVDTRGNANATATKRALTEYGSLSPGNWTQYGLHVVHVTAADPTLDSAV